MAILSKDPLEKAQKAAETAAAYAQAAVKRLASEEAKLAAGREEASRIDIVVKNADPDNAEVFDKLIADRHRLQVKLEPLEFRVQTARESLAAAEAKATDAQVAAWELELGLIRDQVEVEDGVLNEAMFEARQILRNRIANLNRIVPAGNDLIAKIHAARGEQPPAPYHVGTFGSRWAGLSVNEPELLNAAARIVYTYEAENPKDAQEREAKEIAAVPARTR